MTDERTLIVIKPDAVKRALTGKIIERFERVGLKMVACRMLMPTKEQIINHYPNSEDWIRGMGEKTLKVYRKFGRNVKEELGTENPLELGKHVQEKLVKYWLEGPVIVMVWEGAHAIEAARKIRGDTMPIQAPPGSIHGDFSFDSQLLSNLQDRVVKTFVHASGDKKEAEREIEHWFGESPSFQEYERAEHKAMF